MAVSKSKVLEYEIFLNERLKPDLKSILEQRDKIYNEIAEYLALKNSIEAVKSSGLSEDQPLKTKVDLGCNFYGKAIVPNHRKVFVDIGLGFFLEMTHEEALVFVEKKTKHLNAQADILTQETVKIKANIKLVLHGLRELQNLSVQDFNKKQPLYDPLS